MTGIESRIARLEGESAIRQLVSRYCFHIDDRDVAALATLFTHDAELHSSDGATMNAKGLSAIIDQYHGVFEHLGPGQHFTHDISITFIDDDHALGIVSGHAEFMYEDRMIVTAMRYRDQYKKEGEWKFASRLLGFLYYVPIGEYPGILGKTLRSHALREPRPADFPESLDSWISYEQSRRPR